MISELKDRRVYFDALHGNHGDRLIVMAAEELLSQVPHQRVETPSQAEVILVNGGGAMVEGWFGLQRLREYNRRFADTPLVVWPSSYHFPTFDLEGTFAQRTSPAWLWAREEASLEQLRQAGLPSTVHLGLEHDLAFGLPVESLFLNLGNLKPRTVLIVERDDWEGPTGRTRPLVVPGLQRIPESVRAAVRRVLLGGRRKRQDRSPFAAEALRLVQREHPTAASGEVQLGDISLAEVCDFTQFLQHIAEAAVIVTTRLHVAILGHLLETPTYLVDGSYHKFRGVYEHSLRGGSVKFVTWNKTTSEFD